jgi:hypothetical protein
MRLKIVGCNLMFGATLETFKSCAKCELTPDVNECKDDIMCAIRHYIYLRVR